jgi:hypothetical protein
MRRWLGLAPEGAGGGGGGVGMMLVVTTMAVVLTVKRMAGSQRETRGGVGM